MNSKILFKKMGFTVIDNKLTANLPNLKTKIKKTNFCQISDEKTNIYNKKTSNNNLPSQPVPSLSTTLLNFLAFNHAFTQKTKKSHEEIKRVREAYKLCYDMATSKKVEQLQNLLQERSRNLPNWLTPWWLKYGYLKNRLPLPINTSPGVVFPHLENYFGVNGQIELAIKIIKANIIFLDILKRGKLPTDKLANGNSLDMSQYINLFGTTRIPHYGCDEIKFGKDRSEWSRHIIVTFNGHSFYFPIQDLNGEILSENIFRERLIEITNKYTNINKKAINICSADNRNTWAKVYNDVKENNKEYIKLYEDALFVLGLDKAFNNLKFSKTTQKLRQAIHGGGSNENSYNRWFDKTLQFFVNDNCEIYVTYEHTPAEGPPLAALLDFMFDSINNNATDLPLNEKTNKNEIESPIYLNFKINNENLNAIANCNNNFDKAIENLELVYQNFNYFGKNVPKKHKLSPDGFIQIALQLAFYKIHGCHPITYETATLRQFLDGRTETIRLPNDASVHFVEQVFDKINIDSKNLRNSLIEAIQEHKNYTIESMNGNGMDRHLLGLKLMAIECNEEIPNLLKSKIYQDLMHFRLSTSQVPTKNQLAMIFGPSAPDCYGICYNPQEKSIGFTITAFNECKETSCARFEIELENSLLYLQKVLTKSNTYNNFKM